MTPEAPPLPLRRRILLAGLVLLVVALGAMWFYAFFLASNDNPDKIPDRAWAERAEATCAAYGTQIDALPPARSFADVEPLEEALRQRAAVADEVTTLLRAMVADLAADELADGRSRQAVGLWLADWERFLAARDDQVAAWRQGIDRRFVEPPTEEGETTPVSLRMDAFAKVNRMPACQVPGDIG